MRGQYPPAMPLPLTPPPKYRGLPEVTLAEHLRDFDDPHKVLSRVPRTYSGSGEPEMLPDSPYKEGDWYVDILTGTLYVCRVERYSGTRYWFGVTRASLSGVKVDGVPLVPDDDGYVELPYGLQTEDFSVSGGAKVFQLVDAKMNRISVSRSPVVGDRIVVPGAVSGRCRSFLFSFYASDDSAAGTVLSVYDGAVEVFSGTCLASPQTVEALDTPAGWVFRYVRPNRPGSLSIRSDASLSEMREVLKDVVGFLGGTVTEVQ